MFEKEGYSDPVEYHDNILATGAVDVDHRVIPGVSNDLGMLIMLCIVAVSVTYET